MDISKLMNLGLRANLSFQKVHRIVITSKAIEQRLYSKPLEWKCSSHAANQDMEQILSIWNESSSIAGIDKPAEQHANIEEAVENDTD